MLVKQGKVNLRELEYYFDGVFKEYRNKFVHARKYSELLDVQQKMLFLPENQFSKTLEAIKGVIQATHQDIVKENNKLNANEEKASSQKLYDQTIEVRNKRLVSSQTDKVAKL